MRVPPLILAAAAALSATPAAAQVYRSDDGYAYEQTWRSGDPQGRGYATDRDRYEADRDRYDARMRDWQEADRRYAERRADYDRALDQWRRQEAACRAGRRAACAYRDPTYGWSARDRYATRDGRWDDRAGRWVRSGDRPDYDYGRDDRYDRDPRYDDPYRSGYDRDDAYDDRDD